MVWRLTPYSVASAVGRLALGEALAQLTGLEALADILDEHRTAALRASIANGDSEIDEENGPGTLQQSA
jgi:hypothetical protein